LKIEGFNSIAIKLNEMRPDFYFEENGELYLPLNVFFSHFNKKDGTVILPGRGPVKPVIYQGRRVLKLSDLGLKAVIRGNEAWLEWK